MAARMRKKVDRAPLKPSKGLEMTVGEVERLPEQQPVPGAIFNWNRKGSSWTSKRRLKLCLRA